MKRMKCATKDFTEADLPSNRKEMFFDCYKQQFPLILRLGFLCLLLLLPMLVVLFFRDLYVLSALESLEKQTPENVAEIYTSANVVFGLMEMAAAEIFFVLLSGIMQIVRQLCWGEPVFFADDFKRGLKENALRFGLVGLVIAVLGYVVGLTANSNYSFLLYGIFVVVFVPLSIWILLQSLYYTLKWNKLIKNASVYFVRTLPVTIGMLAITVLPFYLVTSFVTDMLLKYLLLVVLAAIIVVPITMMWILYGLKTFDEYINKRAFSDMYRKGLRSEDIA